MRFSISHKLLLLILAAIGLVIVAILLLGQWSIHRGFVRFVNNIEQARLEQLGDDLVTAYGDAGNWDFLRDQPRHWRSLLRGTLPDRPVDPRREELWERHMRGGRMMNRMPTPPPADAPRSFEWRVVLLDSDRELIFGFPQRLDAVVYRPLEVDGKTVGFLGLSPQKRLADSLQLQYLRKQKKTFSLIALGIGLLAALLTLPLTRRLVRPVKALAAATRELTGGNFKVRTPAASHDELGQLSRDFNTLAATLDQNEQARKRWVADISHELRTPLAVLRGEIEALQDHVREVTPQSLESLHGEVMQLGRLVDDLYELSMSDLGALTYKKAMIEPLSLLQKVVDQLTARFEEAGLKIDLELPDGPALRLLADPERLQQLFSNLLENSLRYTDPGGRVELRIERDPEQLTIAIHDTSPGVAPAEIPRLFERLYRVEGSRSRAAGGAGLGLSICRNIVEAHGGRISAKPSPLGGLCLEIVLPLSGELS
ncbi:MAG: two-component sensor histidine kinase [Desulfuromonas sp.]|nr:MAG: two-component sensor histidine kinase [Desulfuromonas sp.]